jgi:hypothetical protein
MAQIGGHRAHRWFRAIAAGALATGTLLLSTAALAGLKGIIVVRPLGSARVTIDGDLADWPLDKFTKTAEQPVFPDGQERETTTANGDHMLFDLSRVGLFNGTAEDGFKASETDFGASMYFAHDDQFLYILGVFIDDVLRGDRDTSEFGSAGYLNDGFEFFLDTKGDSTDCISDDTFPNIDEGAPNADDFQVTVGLNDPFKPSGAAANVLGVRQSLARQGNPDLVGPNGSGAPGGGYQDALTAIGGPDIAARLYDDLRAAGAKNPELAAKPAVKFPGYVVEMRVPFSAKIPGFTPDHTMGFELFWRDVDADDTIAWASWAQSTAVDCGDPKTSLFNTANWGTLVFNNTDVLGAQ